MKTSALEIFLVTVVTYLKITHLLLLYAQVLVVLRQYFRLRLRFLDMNLLHMRNSRRVVLLKLSRVVDGHVQLRRSPKLLQLRNLNLTGKIWISMAKELRQGF